jgi:hypothetical protein
LFDATLCKDYEGVGVIAVFGFRQVNRRGRLGGLTLL